MKPDLSSLCRVQYSSPFIGPTATPFELAELRFNQMTPLQRALFRIKAYCARFRLR